MYIYRKKKKYIYIYISEILVKAYLHLIELSKRVSNLLEVSKYIHEYSKGWYTKLHKYIHIIHANRDISMHESS